MEDNRNYDGMATVERVGLYSVINKALGTAKVKDLLDQKYQELLREIEGLVELAPESLFYDAMDLYLEYESKEAQSEYEKGISECVCNKAGIFIDFVEKEVGEPVPEMVKLLKKRFENLTEVTINEITEIAGEFASMYVQHFLKDVYEAYVPEDMSKETADMIRNIFGGIIIPTSAVIPRD